MLAMLLYMMYFNNFFDIIQCEICDFFPGKVGDLSWGLKKIWGYNLGKNRDGMMNFSLFCWGFKLGF